MLHTPQITFPTAPQAPSNRRLLLALAIALLVHAALFVMPLKLSTPASPRQPVFDVTIIHQPRPVTSTKPEEVAPEPADEKQPPAKAEPVSTPPARPAPQPATRAPEAQVKIPRPTSAPFPKTDDAAPRPIDTDGAKSRSTVFDPRLRQKLSRERNKVRRFESEDAKFRTTTGTFVQQGDRCWEVVQLVSGDTSTESSQWLRRKCPKTSRSEADIDRLARKYGIP